MIDFHTHILPGIDDGSRSSEESIQMLNREQEQGITKIVFTPHFYANRNSVERFLKRREASYERLLSKVPEKLVKDIQFCRGAEVYYFPGIGEAEEISRLCVEENEVMMLEMPFCQWDDQVVRDVQTLINKQKLTVIIVHIERYYPYQKKKEFWERVFELPVYAQVNAESFLHFRTRRKAFMLFEAYNALLGTDCHNMTNRIPNMQQAREVIQKKLGADRLRQVDELGEMILP